MAHVANAPFRCNLLIDANDNYHQNKTKCSLDYALSNNGPTNVSFCDSLTENTDTQNRARCYSIIAQKTQKPEYCKKILEVANSTQFTWTRMDGLKGYKNECYTEVCKQMDTTKNFEFR